MERLDQRDDSRAIDRFLAGLHRSGWSMAEVASHLKGGGLVWVVVGDPEGTTRSKEWSRAVESGWCLGVRRR